MRGAGPLFRTFFFFLCLEPESDIFFFRRLSVRNARTEHSLTLSPHALQKHSPTIPKRIELNNNHNHNNTRKPTPPHSTSTLHTHTPQTPQTHISTTTPRHCTLGSERLPHSFLLRPSLPSIFPKTMGHASSVFVSFVCVCAVLCYPPPFSFFPSSFFFPSFFFSFYAIDGLCCTFSVQKSKAHVFRCDGHLLLLFFIVFIFTFIFHLHLHLHLHSASFTHTHACRNALTWWPPPPLSFSLSLCVVASHSGDTISRHTFFVCLVRVMLQRHDDVAPRTHVCCENPPVLSFPRHLSHRCVF